MGRRHTILPRSVLPAVLTAAPHLLWLLHPLEDKPMGMQMIVMDDDVLLLKTAETAMSKRGEFANKKGC